MQLLLNGMELCDAIYSLTLLNQVPILCLERQTPIAPALTSAGRKLGRTPGQLNLFCTRFLVPRVKILFAKNNVENK